MIIYDYATGVGDLVSRTRAFKESFTGKMPGLLWQKEKDHRGWSFLFGSPNWVSEIKNIDNDFYERVTKTRS